MFKLWKSNPKAHRYTSDAPSVSLPPRVEERLERAGRGDVGSGALTPASGATPGRVAQLDAECDASMALRVARFQKDDMVLAARCRRAYLAMAAAEARVALRRDELARHEKELAAGPPDMSAEVEAQLARAQKLVELAEAQVVDTTGAFDEAVLRRAGLRAVALAEVEALRHLFRATQHAYLRGAAAAASDERTRELIPLLAIPAPEIPAVLTVPPVEDRS